MSTGPSINGIDEMCELLVTDLGLRALIVPPNDKDRAWFAFVACLIRVSEENERVITLLRYIFFRIAK